MSKSYIKLKNVGDAATFTVVRCEPGTGKYPDVEFEDAEGRVYPVPKASADKQLARLGIADESDVVGRAITISRSENKQDPSKSYWNIEWAKGNGASKGGAPNGAATATTQPAVTAQAPVSKEQGASGYKLYRQITEKVLADIVPLYAEHGVQPDAETVHSIVSTLFINAQRGH